MSTQSAPGDRFPTTEAFLRAALNRTLVPVNPDSRGQIAVQANITTNVGHFFVAPPGSEAAAFSLNADTFRSIEIFVVVGLLYVGVTILAST